MNRAHHAREFLRISLEGDSVDLRALGMKDALLNVGMGILMLPIVLLHLILSLWQMVVILAMLGYDLVAKALSRGLPQAIEEVPKDERRDKDRGS